MNRRLFPAAQEEWSHWLSQAEKSDLLEAASAANALGCCFSENGRFNDALEHFSTASRHLRNSGCLDDELSLRIASNKSFALWAKGEADMAADELAVADSIWGQGEGMTKARILLLRGLFALERNEHREALRRHEASARLYEESGQLHLAAMALLNLSISLVATEKIPKAQEILKQCLLVFDEHGDHKHAAYTVTELAYSHFVLGEYGLALESCAESLQRLLANTSVLDRLEIANVFRILSLVFKALGDVGRAEGYIKRAVSIYREHRNPYTREKANKYRDEYDALPAGSDISAYTNLRSSFYQWEFPLNYCESALRMIDSIEKLDEYTIGHSTRVMAYCHSMALKLGIEEQLCKELAFAARFHDLGKISIPRSILTKPGDLDKGEWELVRRHPALGAELIRMAMPDSTAADIVYSHHERYDGTGYPEGLAGDSISITSHILSVADAYDAMTSDRAYRGSLSHTAATHVLIEESGRQFHPEVVKLFVDMHDI